MKGGGIPRSPRRKLNLQTHAGLRRVWRHRIRWRISSAATRDYAREASDHKRNEVRARLLVRSMRGVEEELLREAITRGQNPNEARRRLRETIGTIERSADEERRLSTSARGRAVSAARSAATSRFHAGSLLESLSVYAAMRNPESRLRGAARRRLNPWGFPD